MDENAAGVQWKKYNQIICETEGLYHEASWKLGLSDSAQRILYAICNLGDPCFLSDVIRFSGISKQTINSALRKLEGEEILTAAAAGGRKKQISLTEKGRALAQETVMQIIEIEDEIYSSWTEEERRLYLELTQRYFEAFRERIRDLKGRVRE